jgi:hypothetical protein
MLEVSQYPTSNYITKQSNKKEHGAGTKTEDQWNRIEDLDMNPHSYVTLVLAKLAKTCIGEKTASSTNVAVKSGYLHAKN